MGLHLRHGPCDDGPMGLQQLHKFRQEARHLDRMIGDSLPDDDTIQMVLAQAKRVRTASNLLVRALAQHRDQLQPNKEGTSE